MSARLEIFARELHSDKTTAGSPAAIGLLNGQLTTVFAIGFD